MPIKQEIRQNSEPPLNVILYRERLLRNINIPESDIQFIKKNRPNLLSEQELELTKIYLDDEHQESIGYYPRVLAKTPDQLMKEEERVSKLEIHGSYIKDPHQAFKRNPHLAFMPDQEIINFVTEVEKEGIPNGIEMIGNDSRSIDQLPKIYGEAISRLNGYQTVAIPGSDNFFIHPGVILCKCPEVALLHTEQINSVIQSFFDNGFKHPYRILGEAPILLVRGMLRVNTLISQFPKDQRQSVIDYLERHSEIFDLSKDEAQKELKDKFPISASIPKVPTPSTSFITAISRQESPVKAPETQSPAQLPESRRAINPNIDHHKGTKPQYWWLSTKKSQPTTSEISTTDGTIEKHRGRPKGSRNRDKSPKIIDHVSLSKPNPTTSSNFSLFAPKVTINGKEVSIISSETKPKTTPQISSTQAIPEDQAKTDDISTRQRSYLKLEDIDPDTGLFPVQKNILDIITRKVVETGWSPTMKQISEETGISVSSVCEHIRKLEVLKYLTLDPQNKRLRVPTSLDIQNGHIANFRKYPRLNDMTKPSSSRQQSVLENLVVKISQEKTIFVEKILNDYAITNPGERQKLLTTLYKTPIDQIILGLILKKPSDPIENISQTISHIKKLNISPQIRDMLINSISVSSPQLQEIYQYYIEATK